MARKNDILEAWIMVERLSEGDIPINNKSILTLDDLQGQDFYSFFQQKIKEEKLKLNQKKNPTGGIVVYFDIFDFHDVVSILRETYSLKPTDEEIRTGKKFSFALYFDENLNFQSQMTFFTESAYIRYYPEVLKEKEIRDFEKEFRHFENELNNQFEQDFIETSNNQVKFNKVIQKEILRYKIEVKNCRIQILENIETETANLHSFFIRDLEKAKEIRTNNLNAYLFGIKKEGRINLDSNKESEKFNPHTFEQILQPKNYPVGRFPSNTKYALSLMQQVAVNLSIGFDNSQIRSVNGPPGTGKTTLLRDIFAQLVVQQAYDIAKLSDHAIKGTEETAYFDDESIGVIPEQITENNIVVASSNNGAVQNIVNELPLSTGIDEVLIEDLKQADYFREISNTRENESRNGQEFWGLFSLEGGKANNMKNIRDSIEAIYKYLEKEYMPDQDVYEQFLEQYEKVTKIKENVQAYADELQKLEQVRISYKEKFEQKDEKLHAECQKFKEIRWECEEQLEQLNSRLKEVTCKKESTEKNIDRCELCLQIHEEQKPGLFAGKKKKSEYDSKLNEITYKINQLKNEYEEYKRQEREISIGISMYQNMLEQCMEKWKALKVEFASWKNAEKVRIEDLDKKIRKYEIIIGRSEIKSLNMNQEYNELQMSKPWFDESYRVAQSKLFIAALRVRKQFLYENRENIGAAVYIWKNQEDYLKRKDVIKAAWNWINMTIPVISSTFASFSRMCKYLGADSLGHLFIDEAGQALPQAAVGAIYRSRHVMVVGDPSQIKPVLTLDSNTLRMLGEHFGVTEKYLSASASVQTLTDAASRYGFYRKQDSAKTSWIGIPLWVHRRCQNPMFTISNEISYDGLMVQGMETKSNGKTGWFNIGGTANDKYVKEQGEFLLRKIKKMMDENPKIEDKKEKDEIYVITPFSNVAFQLSKKLEEIRFTRKKYGTFGKPTNVGTVHTFQGKEAPIVFLVLGADKQSSGAAGWAVSEPNIMNVAATRAKNEFYIIGDKELYLGLGGDVVEKTIKAIDDYKERFPELVDDDVSQDEQDEEQTQNAETLSTKVDVKCMTGRITCVGDGEKNPIANVKGDDGKQYRITKNIYAKTDQAKEVIQKGNKISFTPSERGNTLYATYIKLLDSQRET